MLNFIKSLIVTNKVQKYKQYHIMPTITQYNINKISHIIKKYTQP